MIVVPAVRIFLDVAADGVQVFALADYVLEIIALPDRLRELCC